MSNAYYDVFISYSHKNQKAADCVFHSLNDANFRVWMDHSAITPGEGWRRQIEAGVISGCVVYLVSPESKTSTYVEAELTIAADKGIPIFPVLIAGDKGDIIYPFGTIEYIDGRGDQLAHAILDLMRTIYRDFRLPLFYRPLNEVIEYLGPSRESQARAMIYRMQKNRKKLSMYIINGIFMHDILEMEFTPGEGPIGSVWSSNPSKVLLIKDWKGKKADLENEYHLTPRRKAEVMANLGMVAIIPIWSRSYLRPYSPADNEKCIGVLVVDSPRAMDQLDVGPSDNGAEFIEHSLIKASELAILLDLEDEQFPLDRITMTIAGILA